MAQQRVDLARLEVEHRKVDAEFIQIAGLEGEQILVPAVLLGKSVVGDDESPLGHQRMDQTVFVAQEIGAPITARLTSTMFHDPKGERLLVE